MKVVRLPGDFIDEDGQVCKQTKTSPENANEHEVMDVSRNDFDLDI